MFLGIAQNNPSVSLANVLGSYKTHREQIQITGGTGQSTVQGAKYIYGYNYVFGANIDADEILTPGIHYSLSTTTNELATPTAPTLARVTSGGTFANPTTRYYKVVYQNQIGTTPASTEASITTNAANQGIMISWPTLPTGVENVLIYGSSSTGTELLLATVAATTTSWTDPNGVTPGATYPTSNTTGYAPTITSLDSTNCPDGLYDLQFNYVSYASRNDPVNGVTNKIDIYVEGSNIQQASETLVFQSSTTFNSTVGDPLNFTNYIHSDLTYAKSGNYFMPLTFTPVTELPSQITLAATGGVAATQSSSTLGHTISSTDAGLATETGSVTYFLGADYFLVNNQTNLGGTAHGYSGIEWLSVANGGRPLPPANTELQILYDYNAVPRQVETSLQQWRLVGSDAWVHQANQMLLNINLVIIPVLGYTSSQLNGPITSALQTIFSTVGFDQVLSASDLLTAVGQVQGVQAVRFATSTDASNASRTNYAIQQVNSAGSLIETFAYGGRVTDVYMSDSTVPVLNSVYLYTRAQNSFGTGA